MNKPNNKKKCSGCTHFTKMKYGKENGIMFSICDMDIRTNSNGTCEHWRGKKYLKEDRRKLKIKV